MIGKKAACASCCQHEAYGNKNHKRMPALHAGSRGFESLIAQSRFVGLALSAKSPFVVVPIHRAIDQAKELRLRQQALPGHRPEEVVGDIVDLRGMTGLGSRGSSDLPECGRRNNDGLPRPARSPSPPRPPQRLSGCVARSLSLIRLKSASRSLLAAEVRFSGAPRA